MKEPLVSIVTPCYNAAPYLPRYLDSILNQTYPNLELILVDDGSTDDTKCVIDRYAAEFDRRGIRVHLLHQRNSGLGAAVSRGIKYVTGAYLVWPDPDDFLMRESIEKRVHLLEMHPEYGWARSNAYVFDEDDLRSPVRLLERNSSRLSKPWLFDDIVALQFMFCCGCYMLRVSALDDVNPARDLYPDAAGQNIQMLLPIAYKYPCIAIDEPLYGYVIRANSLSRASRDNPLDAQLARDEGVERIMIETLRRIDGAPPSAAERHLAVMRFQRFRAAWLYGDRTAMDKFLAEIEARGESTVTTWLMNHNRPSAPLNFIIRAIDLARRWRTTIGRARAADV